MQASRTVRAGGLDVCFRLEGPADAPVVMLAHGILVSHRMWDAVAQSLLPRWRVLRYDLRGHGNSATTAPPYTMETLARDAIALLDALHIQRMHFIGSSLGGMIGQRLGAGHAHRLLSLTLANTTAVQGAATTWQQRIDIARERGVQPLVEATMQRWFTPDFLAADPEPVRRLRALALVTGVQGFIGCASAVRDLVQADLLARIHVPTLVMAGELDQATPLADSEFMARRIPAAQLVRLPAAHQAAVECPEAVCSAWTAFVVDHL